MDLNKIRNVALIGHSGEGKTSLAEAILFNCGVIDRQGRVEDGNTVMDFDPEEIAKKGSISLACANCNYNGYKINIVDVPGFYDYETEMVQALAVVDSAIIVTSASGSLSVGTEKAIDYCTAHSIPAILFINGLDKENTDFSKTVEAIKERYGTKIAPMIIPNMVDGKMTGFVKISQGKLRNWDKTEVDVPANLAGEYEEAKMALMESAAGNDDELMMKFFDEMNLTPEEIDFGVKKGIVSCSTIAVFGGSAVKNYGIVNLLDNIISTLPSPKDATHPKAIIDGKECEVAPDENGQTIIRVFKTIVDPFVGRVNYVKVISGKLSSGMSLTVSDRGNTERISQVNVIRGKKVEQVDVLTAGDIGALTKLGDVKTGDTLYDGKEVIFAKFDVPAPMYKRAVYAAKKGEEDKIFAGLSRLQDEDISFSVDKNLDTNEMIISGVGATQLNGLCKKLKSKLGVDAELVAPKIAYKETIRRLADGEGKHKKQSGGAGQYGHVKIHFEPGAEDGLYEFVDEVVGGTVPKQFIPAVDKGLREAIKEGVLAGYPLINLKARLYDGSSHPVDSKEVAFVSAAKIAYAQGIAAASPVILEPIMKIVVKAPSDYLGDIMGDMNKRRGRIIGTEQEGSKAVVIAEVPEAESLEYAADLRSLTQGRGTFVIEFARYEEVTPDIQAKIIAEAKKA